MSGSSVRIVLVEDSEIDAQLFRRSYARLNPDRKIVWHPTGDELFAWLETLDHEQRLLVVLDVNLPGQNGFEVLEAFRRTRWAHCPVFLLSGSSDPRHLARAFDDGSAGFVEKDRAGSSFADLHQLLEAYIRVASWPAVGPDGSAP